MAEENIDPGQQKIIDLLGQIAGERGDAKKEEESNDRKTEAKRTLKALKDNGLALVGLTAGMFSLKSLIGNQLKMNQDLATALGQTGDAARGMTAATDRFIRGQQGAEQMVKVFKDAVDMGMTRFSDQTLQFGAQLKVLGIQNKTSFQLMRANTQALGLAEEASLSLAQDLISTAAENKDSISGLIDAINSMRDAMIDTTVELGPKAAMNAQKIAAMMSQGNSELQESSAKFVKSFLAGSDGYMKAAKLGVQFTGKESTAEMARKFETILSKVQGLQAGKQGAGSQFFFDAMEKSFGLSREDFNLQTQIGTSIHALKEGNIQQLAQESANINLQQTIWNKTEPFQEYLMEQTGLFTQTINDIFDTIKDFSPTLEKFLLPIAGGVTSLLGFLGFGGILGSLSMGGSLVKGIASGFMSVTRWGIEKTGGFFKNLGSVFKGVGDDFGMEILTNPKGKKAGVKAASKGLLKKVPGLLKGLAGKLALPVMAGLAMKDMYDGFTADPNAGFLESLGNAGSSALDGLTFGLLGTDSDEIAQNAAQGVMEPSILPTPGTLDQEGGSIVGVLRETANTLKEILESTREGNSLSEDQLDVLSQDVALSPIRAGRMN